MADSLTSTKESRVPLGHKQGRHSSGMFLPLPSWHLVKYLFFRSTFCSHPTQACTQHITSSTTATRLPALSYVFSSALESGFPAPNITCMDSSTLRVRGLAASPGMLYEIIARVRATSSSTKPIVTCTQFPVPFGAPFNASIQVTGGEASEAWVSWVGGTEYSMDAGDAAHNFSFRGADPHAALLSLINAPASATASFAAILSQHVADFKAALTDKFSLSLGQTPRVDVSTDVIKAAYKTDAGDPYLEWLMFNFGRYLLASSGRGLMPANLQGKWANGNANPWGAGEAFLLLNMQMILMVACLHRLS
jgi:alpha-L-fucosidase 2